MQNCFKIESGNAIIFLLSNIVNDLGLLCYLLTEVAENNNLCLKAQPVRQNEKNGAAAYIRSRSLNLFQSLDCCLIPLQSLPDCCRSESVHSACMLL